MTQVHIKIFVEGGGDGRNGRAAIRNGMNGFLKEVKEAARRKRIKWRLTACGGRNEAFDKFMHEIERPTSDFVVLFLCHSLPGRADHPSIVVLDNADIHRAQTVRQACWELAECGIWLWYLPAYSSEFGGAGPAHDPGQTQSRADRVNRAGLGRCPWPCP